MWRGNRFVRFLLPFAVIYGLLIAPWPGWNAGYGVYFRALGQAVFGADAGRWVVRFEPTGDWRPPIDTAIVIANRDHADKDGLPVKKLGIDSRGVGWVPTALIIALTLATPLPVVRRIGAAFIALVLVQGYILFSVGCYILNQSTDLGVLTPAPFWKAVLDGLEETLVTQIGASFVIPALIWLVVVYGCKDFGWFRGANVPGAQSHSKSHSKGFSPVATRQSGRRR
jgi:hypothetical protein